MASSDPMKILCRAVGLILMACSGLVLVIGALAYGLGAFLLGDEV